jgi:hypothetical protein
MTVHQIGGGLRDVRTEAHVERRILHEGKAALGRIELHGRCAQVEHNAVDRLPAQLLQLFRRDV